MVSNNAKQPTVRAATISGRLCVLVGRKKIQCPSSDLVVSGVQTVCEVFSTVLSNGFLFSLDVSVVKFVSFLVDMLSVLTLFAGAVVLVLVVSLALLACAVPKSNAKYTKQTVLGLIMVLFGLLLVCSEVLLSEELERLCVSQCTL